MDKSKKKPAVSEAHQEVVGIIRSRRRAGELKAGCLDGRIVVFSFPPAWQAANAKATFLLKKKKNA